MLGKTTIKPYNHGYVFVFLFRKQDRYGNGPVVEIYRHCLNMVGYLRGISCRLSNMLTGETGCKMSTSKVIYSTLNPSQILLDSKNPIVWECICMFVCVFLHCNSMS